MSIRFYIICGLLALSALASPAMAHRPYTLDQPSMTDHLNDFWSIYGTAEGANGIYGWEDVIHSSSFWYEWNTLKCSWTNYGPFQQVQRYYFNKAKVNGVNADGQLAKGYLWPAQHTEKWFRRFEHFDQMPRFICAVYNDYMWSRDKAFLKEMMPKLEAVMDYMLETMDGKDGLLICTGDNNGLPDTGMPSTYMDCLREGHIAGWINAGYYTALQDMADIESILGNKKTANNLDQIIKAFQANFDKALWNNQAGRYAGWLDVNDKLHDAGYTFINVEALSRGIGDPDKARRIFEWLDGNNAQPTVKGAHKGSKDVYQLVVAPRANTERVPNEDWDCWSMAGRNTEGDAYQFAYGAALEDGGTMLWINYYDVMARLKWLDADNAWKKFSAMLTRCANDPRFLTVGNDHKYSFNPYNCYGEHYLEIGTDDPFPESGISAMSMLYGFMGVWPVKDGLRIAPSLPSDIIYAQCADVTYKDKRHEIRVEKGHLVLDDKQGKTFDAISLNDGEASRSFHANHAFNKLGVLLGTYRKPLAVVKMSLSRKDKGAWQEVFARDLAITQDNSWVYFAVSDQKAGCEYRLTLSDCRENEIAWYKSKSGLNAIRVVDEKLDTVKTFNSSDMQSMQSITIPSTFSRVSILVKKNETSKGLKFTLQRRMGDGWFEVTSQSFASSGWLPLTISDQPKGEYRILIASADGCPVIGIDKVKIERGEYIVRVSPGDIVAPVKAGAAYVLN